MQLVIALLAIFYHLCNLSVFSHFMHDSSCLKLGRSPNQCLQQVIRHVACIGCYALKETERKDCHFIRITRLYVLLHKCWY